MIGVFAPFTGFDRPPPPDPSDDESSNVPIDVLDRCVRELDVLQLKVQQQTRMICRPTTKGLAQFLGRGLDPPIRPRRQLDRIGLARNQRLDHRPTARRRRDHPRRERGVKIKLMAAVLSLIAGSKESRTSCCSRGSRKNACAISRTVQRALHCYHQHGLELAGQIGGRS
jgi:hypothetical protein